MNPYQIEMQDVQQLVSNGSSNGSLSKIDDENYGFSGFPFHIRSEWIQVSG